MGGSASHAPVEATPRAVGGDISDCETMPGTRQPP